MYRYVSFRSALSGSFLVLVAVLSSLLLVSSPASSAVGVDNAGFDSNGTGWSSVTPVTRLARSSAGHAAAGSLQIRSVRLGQTLASTLTSTDEATPVGSRTYWSAWLRSNRTGLDGQLIVREMRSGTLLQRQVATKTLTQGTWTKVQVSIARKSSTSSLVLRVGGVSQRATDELLVDDVNGSPAATTAAPATTPAPATTTTAPAPATTTTAPAPTTTTTAPAPTTTTAPATTTCSISARGIPSCGAFLGSAYGSNTDPAAMETEMGGHLAIHRTYYTASQVSTAVSTATKDLAAGRLPWISFKLPYSWSDMVAGKGDAWALDIAKRLAALNGPVYIAFHHEPEGDGDIQVWRQMQERLAPIVRGAAPNVAYTVILTGWNELYGDAQYRLDTIWPRTTIDLAGFDVYDQYGVVKNGVTNTKGTNLRTSYFTPISAWAAKKGVAWGIAETGFTDAAAVKYPHWVRDNYQSLKDLGGVAFAYFNTTLNSAANWALTTDAKKASYREAMPGSLYLSR